MKLLILNKYFKGVSGLRGDCSLNKEWLVIILQHFCSRQKPTNHINLLYNTDQHAKPIFQHFLVYFYINYYFLI